MYTDKRLYFRAQKFDTDEFVYGNIVEKDNETYIASCIDSKITMYRIKPSTIGQCTGMKDMNGRLIYEGDKVQFGASGNVSVIEYDDSYVGNFYIRSTIKQLKYRITDFKDCKVIGNIHMLPKQIVIGDYQVTFYYNGELYSVPAKSFNGKTLIFSPEQLCDI